MGIDQATANLHADHDTDLLWFRDGYRAAIADAMAVINERHIRDWYNEVADYDILPSIARGVERLITPAPAPAE